MKRVVGVLRGGIGNQLLQLAAYSALAKRSSSRLIVEISAFRHPSQIALGRKPEALSLPLYHNLESRSGLVMSLFPRAVSAFQTLVRISMDATLPTRAPLGIYASEKGKSSREALIKRKSFRYLDAYFGNFSDIPDINDAIFQTVQSLVEMSDQRHGAAIQKISCAIHIRMGDFLSVAPERVIDGEFILRAQSALELCPNQPFLLFSDSYERAEGLLNSIGLTALRPPPGLSDLDELLLMGSAQRLICSESTYSWWAAQMVAKNGGMAAFPSSSEKNAFYDSSSRGIEIIHQKFRNSRNTN